MIFLFLFLFSALVAQPLNVEVSARSAILINGETGAILFEKEAHLPSYPASMTKIATALFLLQKGLPFEQMVTVSAESLRSKSAKGEGLPHWQEADGTMMGLKKGEIVSIEALLHGLMLVSGNDAANVLAETAGGNVSGFVEEMNQYVQSLGCLNTQFCNPHGLHHPEHFTTAYDMALIAKKAFELQTFREIVSKTSYWRPKTNKQPAGEILQKNPLLKPGKHFYEKAIGGKTGYTSAAKNTLAVAAEHEGRRLVAVVLGCEKREERYKDVVRLFEAAFAEEKKVRRLFGKEHLFSREIEGAKEPLRAQLEEELKIEYYPAEEPLCRAFVQWEKLELPIKKGQKVGEVLIYDERQQVLQRGNLLANQEVTPTFIFTVKRFFRQFM